MLFFYFFCWVKDANLRVSAAHHPIHYKRTNLAAQYSFSLFCLHQNFFQYFFFRNLLHNIFLFESVSPVGFFLLLIISYIDVFFLNHMNIYCHECIDVLYIFEQRPKMQEYYFEERRVSLIFNSWKVLFEAVRRFKEPNHRVECFFFFVLFCFVLRDQLDLRSALKFVEYLICSKGFIYWELYR